MLELSSTKTIESKLYPGVVLKYRVMTEGVRNRINLDMASVLAEVRTARAEMSMLNLPKKDDGVTIDEDKTTALDEANVLTLVDKVERLNRAFVDPAYFRHSFVSVEGVVVDGVTPATADAFRDLAPERLFQEFCSAIRAEVELTPSEAQSLESPTTSVA